MKGYMEFVSYFTVDNDLSVLENIIYITYILIAYTYSCTYRLYQKNFQ